MRTWVIDAMNVIGARPTGWWRDRPGAIRRLVETARRFAAATGEPVTVVVDGGPLPDRPEGVHDGVRVLYARRPGRNAGDDRIVELLETERSAAPVRVVTSDRALRARVEALGAEVCGAPVARGGRPSVRCEIAPDRETTEVLSKGVDRLPGGPGSGERPSGCLTPRAGP